MAVPFVGTAAGEALAPIVGSFSGQVGRAGTKQFMNAAGITDPKTRAILKFVGTAASHFAGSIATKAVCHGATLDGVGAATLLPTLGVGKSTYDGLTHAAIKALPKKDQAGLRVVNGIRYLDGISG